VLQISSITKFGKIFDFLSKKPAVNTSKETGTKSLENFNFDNFYLNEQYRGLKRLGTNYNVLQHDSTLIVEDSKSQQPFIEKEDFMHKKK